MVRKKKEWETSNLIGVNQIKRGQKQLQPFPAHKYLQNPSCSTSMYEEEPAVGAQPTPNEEPQKITNQLRGERISSQFQKNYPKNIFIPIIEYLAQLGLRTHYEAAVGTREEFEGKNVVSLSLIHQLLSQSWFESSVNKALLEANISNKILINSKIKKKLFHLKVAKVLLHLSAQDSRQYKKMVSRSANAIAANLQQDDDLFEYPSSIIYLLNLFSNALRKYSRSAPPSENGADSEHSNSSPSRQFNSKQEFKTLTKAIIHLLGKIKGNQEALQHILEKIETMIRERAKEINQKYQLAQGVPNWEFFCSCIVSRCFRHKAEGAKVTNSLFNQWVLQFKQRSSQVGLTNLPCVKQSTHKSFTPVILILPPQE